MLAGDPDIDHWSSYVGQGAVRFVFSFDVQPASPNFGQIVIVDRRISRRATGCRAKLKAIVAQDFPGTDAFVHLLDIGPARRTPGAVPRQRARTSRPCATWRRRLAAMLVGNIHRHATSSTTGTSRRAW